MCAAPKRSTRIRSVVPHFGMRRGISSCMISICENLDPARYDAEAWVWGASADSKNSPTLRLALPRAISAPLGKFGMNRALYEILQARYLSSLEEGTLAWLWPGFGLELVKKSKRRGAQVVIERINSSLSNARRIMDEASERLGFPAEHGITDARIQEEREEIELADWIFICSPFVERSFLESGVNPQKLISCTYGWDPERFQVKPKVDYRSKEPVFLFVADGIVRKGLPDLLECWGREHIPGKLRILGSISPQIAARYSEVLSRSNVETLGMRSDLAHQYESADVFVLPSLEEGSPLVTYLAMAAGLPSLVSLAGSGGIVTDGVHGLLCEPHDHDGMCEAFHKLATDHELREKFGKNSLEASRRFGWQEVARARGQSFDSIMSQSSVQGH